MSSEVDIDCVIQKTPWRPQSKPCNQEGRGEHRFILGMNEIHVNANKNIMPYDTSLRSGVVTCADEKFHYCVAGYFIKNIPTYRLRNNKLKIPLFHTTKQKILILKK